MRRTITVTRKGQTTLPAPLRRKLGLDPQGGTLQVRFNEQRSELVLSKPLRASELGERISRHLKSGIKPLVNVDAYYQQHRERRSRASS